MALTRARVVYGSAAARKAVREVIDSVLVTARDRTALARDIVKMRADMATHKPPLGPLDVKLAPGGLVDLEFSVHFHQLASGIGIDPHLPPAIGALADAQLVDSALATAHDLLTRLIVTLRLVSPSMEPPGLATRAIVARACRAADWDELLAQVAAARQCISAHWQAVVDTAGGN